MGRVTINLPRLGETMEEAKVVDWLVAVGAAFRRGDVLLEVETDKTVVEVPALTDGILRAQLVVAGETVALEHPIAEVEVEGAGDTPALAPATQQTTKAPSASPPLREAELAVTSAYRPADATTGPRPAASPAARAAARKAGVDLSLVQGTGRRGRIMAADISAGAAGDIAVHDLGGTGTPIVLLHGLFDDHRGWRDLPRRLAALGHRVLAVDLPGHGQSTAIAHSLEAAVDLIAKSLPQGPLHLIGHSLGGAIATRLATHLGARAASLVLLAPAGLGARINAAFTDGMLAAQTPAALSRALSLLDAGPLSAMALTQELARLHILRPGQAALANAVAQAGFQQIDITADLARLTCPIRVVFGTMDRILDWHDVAQLPPTAAIHLIKGAGHLPHAAAPDLIAALFDQEIPAPPLRGLG
ncbi:MAG: alpha/beta fold hydrolase [Rhodobacteraceae bacterium]|nr:alpha/beta fold hydrolase [Paracoccaceae bacterium]MCF8515229.1 alpha/beta fold hydrolase [Paracoccaceae bacterium]MCF8519587.1 alpha/beta fold hydrolase [Paracoccaceae bacterium]